MTGKLNDAEGGGLSSSVGEAARARQLFRYLSGEAWWEYRAIVGVFAGTFFTEFTPDEVATEPTVVSTGVDPAVVPDRLESLRRWGNLTVSSSVGNPSSLDDYYRRRKPIPGSPGPARRCMTSRNVCWPESTKSPMWRRARLRDLEPRPEQVGRPGRCGIRTRG